MPTIYTIGHSNHDSGSFVQLLRQTHIEVLVDVRSNPNSAWASFANREKIRSLLSSFGIRYLYMGDSLGGQPSERDCYDPRTGKVDYALVQRKGTFKQGIARLLNGALSYTVCIMCAEESPANCHRSLLLSDALAKAGAEVLHIRADGRIQTNEELAKERAGVPGSQQTLAL